MTHNDLIRLIAQHESLTIVRAQDMLEEMANDARVPTKRELFAAMAMQGLMSGVECHAEDVPNMVSDAVYAREAVSMADALLTELVKERT